MEPRDTLVCKPNIDCTLPENKWRYIETFECLSADDKLLKEMRLSFPSGHSSFSAYTMLYFAKK
ncbi:putative phosphatidate phosphatase [Operophtera brumata]|uniref:Putative phosphatidate phosphatase n=1 Tax=Operophtera brumata TaxID=104452 RepID=A0A0L7L216_OPEBR|nr:putative phosphatidate phosphatase [Operophtera brumata]